MKKLPYLTAILGCGLIWQIAAWALGPVILPYPGEVLTDFFYQLQQPVFWGHAGISAFRAGAGLILALAVAFPLGIILGLNRTWDTWLGPFIYLTYPIPKILLLPILLVLLGLGEAPKIILVALTAGYQILVVTRDQVHALDNRYLESFYTLLPSSWKPWRRTLSLIRHVALPAALPGAVTSLRLASGTAVAVLFMVESFATQQGLGYLIMDAWGGLNLPRMFSGILSMSILGLAIYGVANYWESRFSKWT